MALRSLLQGGAPTAAPANLAGCGETQIRSDAFRLGSEEGTVPSLAVLYNSPASLGREQSYAGIH